VHVVVIRDRKFGELKTTIGRQNIIRDALRVSKRLNNIICLLKCKTSLILFCQYDMNQPIFMSLAQMLYVFLKNRLPIITKYVIMQIYTNSCIQNT